MKKRILLFPKDTPCPMPHGYWTYTRDHIVVKAWQMQEREDMLWQMAIRAIGGDDEQNQD